MNELLKLIIEQIKSDNESSNTLMRDDESNERLLAILKKHDLHDDADSLARAFGLAGLHAIRDAEAGLY